MREGGQGGDGGRSVGEDRAGGVILTWSRRERPNFQCRILDDCYDNLYDRSGGDGGALSIRVCLQAVAV